MAKTPRTPKIPKVQIDSMEGLLPELPGQPVVVNLRTLPPDWAVDPNYIYIGRAGHGLSGSWGNPITPLIPCRVCGQAHDKPKSTIVCYGTFLRAVYTNPGTSATVRRNLLSLTGRRLVCFCAPAPCHGHEIVRVWRTLVVDHSEADDVRSALRAALDLDEPQ